MPGSGTAAAPGRTHGLVLIHLPVARVNFKIYLGLLLYYFIILPYGLTVLVC
eukprot:SAG31_NODE_8017_length_1540_cov_1.092991_2_plen_51_part_01